MALNHEEDYSMEAVSGYNATSNDNVSQLNQQENSTHLVVKKCQVKKTLPLFHYHLCDYKIKGENMTAPNSLTCGKEGWHVFLCQYAIFLSACMHKRNVSDMDCERHTCKSRTIKKAANLLVERVICKAWTYE